MDFEGIQTRIQRSLSLDSGSLDDEATRLLLLKQTARYAEAPIEIHRELAHEVIEVRRAGALVGLPRARVKEIRNVSLCLLPHMPPSMQGIFHIRGKVACAIDLQPLLGDATPLGHGDRCMVAMLTDPRGDVGLRVDDVIGLRRVYADEIDDAQLERSDFVTAVTQDLLVIMDVSRLLDRPEFTMTRPGS